jgi:PAS domain S-box-containing protein
MHTNQGHGDEKAGNMAELSRYNALLRARVSELERFQEEQRENEIALRQAEEKYRNIFENAIEGIFQISPEGRFINANPALAKVHGYTSPEDLMTGITDIAKQLYVDPERRAVFLAELSARGYVENFEVRMRRKDGSFQWISINSKAVRDSGGRLLYHEGTMQDITARKAAEEALLESEERYRTAIEHSNDGVALIQGDRHEYVNRRLVEMFGYDSPDELVGRPVTVLAHPDDHAKVAGINQQRQRGEPVPSRYEFKGITKAGAALYVEVSATSIGYRGKLVYLVYLRDMTERKAAEEAVRAERNRFQTLSESAPFGIAVVQNNGVFSYVNPKFQEIFGYTLSDVPSRREWFRRAYPDPHYRRQVIAMWMTDARNANPGQRVPRTFVTTCKDGAEKTINFIPVRLVTGEYLISYEDISDRIKAQAALVKSHKELEQLNRAKTKAVNHISHELKTPLSVIQGNVRVMRRKLGDGQQVFAPVQGLLDAIDRNLERLFGISKETDEIFKASQELEAAMILDDLERLWERVKDLSEMPPEIREHWTVLKTWMGQYLSGRTPSFQTVDLYAFVLTVLEKVKRYAAPRHVDYQLDGENDLFIHMDAEILREVAEGLLRNAVENTPDGGTIHVGVERKDEKILLQIEDTGIGITEQNQQYIFDGLFHTKETELYSSRRPYDFGAGGKGLDLLRMKVHGQRFGFDLSMESIRCVHIPTDDDLCPGDISRCPHVTSPAECAASGGSIFTVSFPARGRGSG